MARNLTLLPTPVGLYIDYGRIPGTIRKYRRTFSRIPGIIREHRTLSRAVFLEPSANIEGHSHVFLEPSENIEGHSQVFLEPSANIEDILTYS
jgi:hypothetical protein